jgi:hypothetical protein
VGEVAEFKATKKSIVREGLREIEKLYYLSHGGDDPITCDEERALFEAGEIDEVSWVDFQTAAKRILERIGEDN